MFPDCMNVHVGNGNKLNLTTDFYGSSFLLCVCVCVCVSYCRTVTQP
jgi:hypothetical protein